MSNISINPTSKEASALSTGDQTLSQITDITPPLTNPGSKTYSGHINVRVLKNDSSVLLEKQIPYSINKVKEEPSVVLTPYLSRYDNSYNLEYQQTSLPSGSLDIGHLYGLPYSYVPLGSPDGVYKLALMNEWEDDAEKCIYEMYFRVDGCTVGDLSYVPGNNAPSGKFQAVSPIDDSSPNVKLVLTVPNNPTLDPRNFSFNIKINNQDLPGGTTFEGIIDPGEVISLKISSTPIDQAPTAQHYELVWLNREPSINNNYDCELTLNKSSAIDVDFNLDELSSLGNNPPLTDLKFIKVEGEAVTSEESGSSSIPAVNPTNTSSNLHFSVPSKVGTYNGLGLYAKVKTQIHIGINPNGSLFNWDGNVYFKVYRLPTNV